MSFDLSAAAYAASLDLKKQGLNLPRSHVSEILAALLGYGSLAALHIENGNSTLDYHLDDAELLVLNLPACQQRAIGLGYSAAVVAPCVEAITAHALVPVFKSVDDFYFEHAYEALVRVIAEGEDVASVMADSNASYPDDPDLEEWETSGDLWTSPMDWTIGASGTWTGEYDPDGDRMFNGNTLDVRGRLVYAKAGRAGLIRMDEEDGASPVDDWRDEKY
ncbi:hypothetical protein D3C71_1267100 [compost metagenome]